jgi:hypothetical protein
MRERPIERYRDRRSQADRNQPIAAKTMCKAHKDRTDDLAS